MIELFSAVLLICMMDESTTVCKTTIYAGTFDNHIDCINYLTKTEKENGREWAEKEEYVVSTTCIDWKFKTLKI